MRKVLIGIVLSLAVLGATAPAGAEMIHEDDPRWNCATMGNHVCGHLYDAEIAAERLQTHAQVCAPVPTAQEGAHGWQIACTARPGARTTIVKTQPRFTG
jgi:hypothetical protein